MAGWLPGTLGDQQSCAISALCAHTEPGEIAFRFAGQKLIPSPPSLSHGKLEKQSHRN
jgi:hypothetical protein